MADITNPQVIKFLNEYVRPLAEDIRNGKLFGDDMTARYESVIEPIITANDAADLIEDGRAAEGVSRLTKGDLAAFIAVVKAMGDSLDSSDQGGTDYMPVIRKPCVRAPR